MAGESTIGREYAEALFMLATDNGERAVLDEELREIAKLFRENRDIKNFFASPGTPRDEKLKVIDEVFKPNVSRTTAGIMHLLVRKGRAGYLERIIYRYQQLVNEAEGRVEVKVTSAQPVSAELLAQLENGLKRSHGDKLSIESAVDERLIGGMTVRIGDRLLDSSVRSRLRRLRELTLGAGMR